MSEDAAGTSACATLCPRGVDLLGIHAQLGEGGDRLLGVEPALARQARKRGGRDGFGVDLEVAAHLLAGQCFTRGASTGWRRCSRVNGSRSSRICSILPTPK